MIRQGRYNASGVRPTQVQLNVLSNQNTADRNMQRCKHKLGQKNNKTKYTVCGTGEAYCSATYSKGMVRDRKTVLSNKNERMDERLGVLVHEECGRPGAKHKHAAHKNS